MKAITVKRNFSHFILNIPVNYLKDIFRPYEDLTGHILEDENDRDI